MVNRAGARTELWTGQDSVRGVAWTPDGREVWFTTNQGTKSMIRAVTLSGEDRVVHTTLTRTTIFDIAPDGRVLLGTRITCGTWTRSHRRARPRRVTTRSRGTGGRGAIFARRPMIAITDQTFRGYTT